MFAVLLLFPLIMGAPTANGDSEKPKCCSAEAWQGKMFVVDVHGYNPSLSLSVSFDPTANVLCLAETTKVGSEEETHRTIENRTEKMKYTISKQGCYKRPLDYPSGLGCVPVGSVQVGQVDLGVKTSVLKTKAFEFRGEGLTAYSFVTDDGCFPVADHVISLEPDGSISVVYTTYVNVTVGISDPDTFKVPDNCVSEETPLQV